MAYNLSEQVEEHAYHTYDEFLKQNGTSLSLERPPAVAVNYYEDINNLYDVFVNVRNDEGDHVKTMQDCQLELDERWKTFLNISRAAATATGTYISLNLGLDLDLFSLLCIFFIDPHSLI